MRTTALDMALIPRIGALGLSDTPPRSGGRVIKKILRRSKGAVHVRDTGVYLSLSEQINGDFSVLTPASYATG